MRGIVCVSLAVLLALSPLAAQDGFAEQSFGFDDADEDTLSGSGKSGGGEMAFSVGGEVTASVLSFYNDIADSVHTPWLDDLFSAKLNLAAESSSVDLVLNMKFRPQWDSLQTILDSPITIDEAYVRAYFGAFDIEGGLRKLTWGKADSMGPLDVINPLDFSDFSAISDMMNLKIARPLVHLSYRFGSFSKIESVVIPAFEPARFAETGRWAAGQMAHLAQLRLWGCHTQTRYHSIWLRARGSAVYHDGCERGGYWRTVLLRALDPPRRHHDFWPTCAAHAANTNGN